MKTFRTAMLYVGAVIGAGFATGKEIVTFFGASGIVSAIIAGLLLGVFCSLFLLCGKTNCFVILPPFVSIVLQVALFVSTALVYLSMCSGASQIVFDAFGIRGTGLILGTITCFVMLKQDFLARVNSVIIVAVVGMMLYFLRYATPCPRGEVATLRILQYCGLNVMLGGYVVSDEGRKMKGGQIALAGVLSGGVLALMLAVGFAISKDNAHAAMPVFEFAKSHGLGGVCSVIILGAIITTMFACARALYSKIVVISAKKVVAVLLIAVLSLIGNFLDFGWCVKVFFNVAGCLGVVWLIVAVACLSIVGIRRNETKNNSST
ncbi:MAG: hypothetical protein SO434_03035 [Eubacteriales bacterium]|nr:hypothetical protein [Eubacteriales bacterium]